MKQKKMTRLLAGLLALVLLLSLVPVAFAAEPLTELPATDGMQMSKTATLEADGTVTIRLEAYATGTTTFTETEVSVPLDVVLIVDQSGSMDDYLGDLRKAITGFVNNISADAKENNVDHRIAIVGFASDGDNYNQSAWENTGLFVNGQLVRYSEPKTNTSYEYNPVYVLDQSKTYYYRSSNYSSNYTAVTFSSSEQSWGYTSGFFWNQEWVAVTPKASAEDTQGYQFYERTTVTTTTDGAPTEEQYKEALVSVNTGDDVTASITTAIDNIAAYGGTRPTKGAEMATKIFENNPSTHERKRVVVFFTDGMPGAGTTFSNTDANGAIAGLYEAKSEYGVVSYSVGFFANAPNDSSNTSKYMNYLSSNYPNAQSMTNPGTGTMGGKYYMTTNDSSELEKIFETISESAIQTGTSVKLTTESVMKDIINPAALVLPELPEGTEIGSIVKIETWAGSRESAEAPVVFTEQTETAANVSVIVDEATGTVSVTGFDYSEKFIAPTHDGEKLVVIITGLVPSEAAATGEEVDTNAQGTGIYENAEATEYIPFNHPTLCIPVHSYVIDYAKPFGFSATEWNEKINLIKTLAEKMGCVTGNLKAELDMVNGKVVFTDTDLTYTTQTMNWNGYDSFYALTQDSAALNQWNKVNIIPATSVYYEDTFVTNEATGTVGITYTGEWSTAEAGANQETAGPVQGWVESLADDATVSDGTEATTSTAGAKATFNFTGTGVDIYSRTNLEAGVIRVKLFKVTDSGESMIKYLKMDCESASGEYYQIPTAFFSGLEHGEYKVELEVISTSTSNANYSLDGIRVYNPLATGDKTVNDAYADNGISVDAVFTCLRDLLKDANALAPTESGLPQFSEEFANGNAVFIDKAEDGTTGVLTTSVGTYLEYGPKNEVYLAPGQALTFKVNGTPAYTYVGIKAPEGTGSATFSNNGEAQNATLSAADLYYAVTPDANGAIVITNSGDKIISVTKLVTPAAEGSALMNLSAEAAIEAVNAFSALPVAEYTGNTVTETPAEPEAPVEPDPTEPEIPDVEIENPEQPEEPEEPVVVIGWLQQLFSALRNWFRT